MKQNETKECKTNEPAIKPTMDEVNATTSKLTVYPKLLLTSMKEVM